MLASFWDFPSTQWQYTSHVRHLLTTYPRYPITCSTLNARPALHAPDVPVQASNNGVGASHPGGMHTHSCTEVVLSLSSDAGKATSRTVRRAMSALACQCTHHECREELEVAEDLFKGDRSSIQRVGARRLVITVTCSQTLTGEGHVVDVRLLEPVARGLQRSAAMQRGGMDTWHWQANEHSQHRVSQADSWGTTVLQDTYTYSREALGVSRAVVRGYELLRVAIRAGSDCPSQSRARRLR